MILKITRLSKPPLKEIPKMSMDIEKSLEQIAKTQLGIPTLKVRNSNELDFHNLSVQEIKSALEAAFTTGAKFGMKEVGNAIDDAVEGLKKNMR